MPSRIRSSPQITRPSYTCWISWTICSRMPGFVDLREEVCQHERFDASAFGDDGVVLVIPAGRAVRRRRLGPAEIVVHVDQDVAAFGQLHDGVARAAVAGVADRSLGGVDAKREALEIGLDVLRMADGDFPAVALDDRSRVDLGDPRRRPLAGRLAAPRLEHVQAAAMLDARANVGTVDAVHAEQLFGHARNRRRAVHLQIADPIRALVPSLEHEAAVVHAMVVVQVGEERMRHVDGAVSALDQPLMRAGAVIPHDEIRADLDQITRTLSLQGGCGRSGAEQRDRERLGLGRRRRTRWSLLFDRARRGGGRDGQAGDEVSAVHANTSRTVKRFVQRTRRGASNLTSRRNRGETPE